MSPGTKGQQHDRTASILYGSETGTAQDAAEELGRITERLHFVTRIVELDACNISSLRQNSLVVFVVSTTGQGDLPANARSFWKSLLRKRLPVDVLQDVAFTLFGLGDSSYPKFNWAARKLHKRVTQLGAKEIYPRGEADEQHPEGIDGGFLPWSVDFRKHILHLFPLPDHSQPIPGNVLLQPKWTLELADSHADKNVAEPGLAQAVHAPDDSAEAMGEEQHAEQLAERVVERFIPKNSFTVTLDQNARLTPETHWQDVRHITFTSPTLLDYGPGDTLTIFPNNFPEDVDHLISLMEWDTIADISLRLVPTTLSVSKANYPPPPLPNLPLKSCLTLRELLTHHLDITAIPRRSFFSLIAHFTQDEMQQDRLQEFTNPEYVDELYDYTTRPRRSILEVLQEFDSVKIPWAWAATVLPILRGRQFSIASGGRLKRSTCVQSKSRIELLVAIVKYRTVIKRIRQGVCTRYLASLSQGTTLNVVLQTGGLNMSKSEGKRPVVMVGPGTGIAPMRSLLWERLAWKDEATTQRNGHDETQQTESELGEQLLFFGCRNKGADYFYKDEWEELGQSLSLGVFAAFSRDQRHKIYVQDIIREQSPKVFQLLHQRAGIVYICGSSGKMPQAVREALIEVFQAEGGMEREASEAYLLSMEKEGRYKQETW
ncbi:MAG: NAPDH-dependent diflavin reductase [Piccolia ochrophora]|nr:MAG: NAPDH-dependent diflavin reductase [Piccolia ochrophora]